MSLCLLFRRASVSKSLRRNSLLQYQQSDYKKSLGRIFGAATPPGALVCYLLNSPLGGEKSKPTDDSKFGAVSNNNYC